MLGPGVSVSVAVAATLSCAARVRPFCVCVCACVCAFVFDFVCVSLSLQMQNLHWCAREFCLLSYCACACSLALTLSYNHCAMYFCFAPLIQLECTPCICQIGFVLRETNKKGPKQQLIELFSSLIELNEVLKLLKCVLNRLKL